jgi:hypothetical protein
MDYSPVTLEPRSRSRPHRFEHPVVLPGRYSCVAFPCADGLRFHGDPAETQSSPYQPTTASTVSTTARSNVRSTIRRRRPRSQGAVDVDVRRGTRRRRLTCSRGRRGYTRPRPPPPSGRCSRRRC